MKYSDKIPFIMRNVYILLLGCLFLPLALRAQNEQRTVLPADTISSNEPLQPILSGTTSDMPAIPIPQSGYVPTSVMYGITPFDYSYATWVLHEGFNASIGMNLTFSPSKHAPSGVGFGQDAAFMYAVPLNKRLSVAGGVYASNLSWGFLTYRNVGIAGVAAYKVNDRISLYAYGNKSLAVRHPYYTYPLPDYCPDRIGGMVNFKLNESSSISIGMEGRKNDYLW